MIKNNSNKTNIYDITISNNFFTVQDGLSDNSLYSIIEDGNGNLWLGTGSGISFFNSTHNTFKNFSTKDGIIGSLMNPEAALKLKNGLMLFGSTEGLNVFDPKNIKQSNYIPNLVITNFLLFNKSVKFGKNSLLKESISTTKEINLFHEHNVFSFEFTALDFNSSQSIQYAYKMEGFDKDWIYSGTRRFVTYTNLEAGKYIFKIKSTNADGVWNNNIKELAIIMNPPWWKTIWAYGMYFTLSIIGLFILRRFELNRTKLRNELKLKEFEVLQKSELEELKSRFFANLSHEFRTPLMLIKGPLEQLKHGKNNSENIDLIERNSERLKELIDQLLELSQLEKAAIPLKAKEENLIIILKGLVSSFQSIAKDRNINLTFENNLQSQLFWIDKDKLEKIVNNLLSNSIKFTPENGNILVIVDEKLNTETPVAEITISDSGISIPEDKLDKIFDRFFQVDDSTQRLFGGSGIGLSLVKEFIDLHKWQISVQSEFGKGTEFKIDIPFGEEYLNEDEKVITEYVSDSDITNETEKFITQVSTKQEHLEIISKNKKSILIVDDSEDVRKYLDGLLRDEFLVLEAENGIQGIKTATETMPDLIISDVMMPSMGGIEFCNHIKQEWQTSDIPVILLTAKASFESKMEGLETGADDYLTKPFEQRELFIRIKNLLEQRSRLKNKYSKNLDLLSETKNLDSADDEFIKKTLAIIESNLDKPNFSTEFLAKELFVSRTKLHRKILEITGQAPGEFIRIIKLKKAAKLLLEDKLSVTQISFEIGFASPAQFTRAFSKQFECLPSEFKSKNKPQI